MRSSSSGYATTHSTQQSQHSNNWCFTSCLRSNFMNCISMPENSFIHMCIQVVQQCKTWHKMEKSVHQLWWYGNGFRLKLYVLLVMSLKNNWEWKSYQRRLTTMCILYCCSIITRIGCIWIYILLAEWATMHLHIGQGELHSNIWINACLCDCEWVNKYYYHHRWQTLKRYRCHIASKDRIEMREGDER